MEEREKELLMQVVETAVRTEEAVRGMERELTLVRANLHEYKSDQSDTLREVDERLKVVEERSKRNWGIIRLGMTILSALLSGAYAKLLGIITF